MNAKSGRALRNDGRAPAPSTTNFADVRSLQRRCRAPELSPVDDRMRKGFQRRIGTFEHDDVDAATAVDHAVGDLAGKRAGPRDDPDATGRPVHGPPQLSAPFFGVHSERLPPSRMKARISCTVA